jgi:hypothetical protein
MIGGVSVLRETCLGGAEAHPNMKITAVRVNGVVIVNLIDGPADIKS